MSATRSPRSPVKSHGTARVQLATGSEVILDARRAVYFPTEGLLALADLHLGYSWVQRQRGSLLPLSAPDSTIARVSPLLVDYRPRRVVVLGDLVHQAVALPALQEELRSLVEVLPPGTELLVCLGNHDRDLARLVDSLRLPLRLVPFLSVGRHRLHHGDRGESAAATPFTLEAEPPMNVIGHEHPALRVSDGVATAAKIPCFLLAESALVLPAFSDWAAGCEVGRSPFLGEAARRAKFHSAYGCFGPRLLRVPLGPRN